MNKKKQNMEKGFSLLEIIIALGVFSLLATSVFSLTMGSLYFYDRAASQQKADELINEADVALRQISTSDWSALAFDQSALDATGGYWRLAGEGTSEIMEGSSRKIFFYPAYRDASHNIVASSTPGAQTDQQTRKAMIVIGMREGLADQETFEKTIYLTKYR